MERELKYKLGDRVVVRCSGKELTGLVMGTLASATRAEYEVQLTGGVRAHYPEEWLTTGRKVPARSALSRGWDENPMEDIERDQLLHTIRELMLALEYSRHVCEHADGKNARESDLLARAMSVGIRIGARHKSLVTDFQQESYWKDVWAIPVSVGLQDMRPLDDDMR
jgi:hypothetical protein